MKDIVIIDHEPMTIRKNQIWHIEELQAYGLRISFWDISGFIHPGMEIADTLDAGYILRFTALEGIRHQLAQMDIDKTIFIVEVPDDWSNKAFFRLLSSKNCFTVRIELYASIYMEHSSIRGWKKLKAAPATLYRSKLQSVGSGMLLKLYKKAFNVKGYDLRISSHTSGSPDILINHPDWEHYKDDIATPTACLFEKPYVVFIDEYYPLHPDQYFFTLKQKTGREKEYQQSMIAFFDAYEQRHGVRVVIAAHPKADYRPGTFGDRPIIKYHTNSLIQHAKGVFIHSSAAVAYAVLFDRPIAFITNAEYCKSKSQSYFQIKMADNFGCRIWNIDQNDFRLVCMETVDKQRREQYIYSTLTSHGNEAKKTADILCQTFSAL